jgi:hypothetical protein
MRKHQNRAGFTSDDQNKYEEEKILTISPATTYLNLVFVFIFLKLEPTFKTTLRHIVVQNTLKSILSNNHVVGL